MVLFADPHVSAEAEQRERENLTEEERSRISADIHGNRRAFDPDDDFIDEAQQQSRLDELQQALERVSDQDKRDYLEALDLAPELVEREASLRHFVSSRDGFDAAFEACRLAGYWRIRKKLFGDRSLLPMTLANGAMEESDVELLRRGLVQILPRDVNGRCVFYYEKEKFNPSLGFKTLARCLFYVSTVAIHLESTKTRGVVLITNLKYYDLENYNRKFALITADIFNIILAVKCVHLCYQSSKSVATLLLPIFKFMMSKLVRHKLLLHIGENKDIADELRMHGIMEIPNCIGGTSLPNEYIQMWVAMRLQAG